MEDAETNAEPVARRQAYKQTRELQIVEGDRVAMLGAANTFVNLMIIKQTDIHGGDMLPGEVDTYEAALGFLRRQFEIGHKEAEAFDRKIEHEEVLETD